MPQVQVVIDLISPENETTSSVAKFLPVEDEDFVMEAMDSHSDVDSSPWTSCEGSPAQFRSDTYEVSGQNEFVDTNMFYPFDPNGYEPQMVDIAPQRNELNAFNMFGNSGDRFFAESSVLSEDTEQIVTGFPGPMDEYYEEIRKQALKNRPL